MCFVTGMIIFYCAFNDNLRLFSYEAIVIYEFYVLLVEYLHLFFNIIYNNFITQYYLNYLTVTKKKDILVGTRG